MKQLIIIALFLMAAIFAGCEDSSTKYVSTDNPPARPQGVYSITGDEMVTVIWLPVLENDVKEYWVWRSPDDSAYYYLDATTETYYVDDSVTNGVTYFYAVSAVDQNNHESKLSYETVFDTPRPEGTNVLLFSMYQDASRSGFDLSEQAVVPWNDPNADFFLSFDSTFKSPDTATMAFFINVSDTMTDIQDMGFTHSFDEISYVADSLMADSAAGWSKVGWSEVIFGHTYVFWTADNHFAKIRIYQIVEPSAIAFDWAYQTAPGNLELAPPHDDNGDNSSNTISGEMLK
jgi:hypothetical protein